MFLRYDLPPARMERLFAAFRRQAVRVDRVRRFVLLGTLAAVPVYAAVTAAVLSRPESLGMTPRAPENFRGLLAAGAIFLAAGWIVGGFLSRPRHPLGASGNPFLFLSFAMVPLAVGYAVMMLNEPRTRDSVTAWLTRMSRDSTTADIWVPWGLAGLGVFLASRFHLWIRLADARVQRAELDHAARIVLPLLRDLPADAACSLACNPYPARWTVVPRVVDRGDRRLGVHDDVLLDFHARIPGGAACGVRTSHRRIDKYKVRKGKFKGRKHVFAQRLVVERPGGGPLAGPDLARFEELATRLADGPPGCVTEVDHALAEDVLRLSLRRKWKLAHAAELPAEKLPDPRATLAAIRELSRFAAELRG